MHSRTKWRDGVGIGGMQVSIGGKCGCYNDKKKWDDSSVLEESVWLL